MENKENGSPKITCKDELVFSKVLNQIITDRALTQKQVAELAGVSPSTINDWLCNVQPSNLLALKRLARALGVSLSYLLFEEIETKPMSLDETFERKEILDGIYEVSLKRLVVRGSNGGK